MLKLLIRFLGTAAAFFLIAHIVPGITVSSIPAALIAAVVWGVVSVTIRPLLLLLTLPINFLTLGLFTFIINALLFWLAAAISPGFSVAGFIPALEGSFLLTLVSWALHAVL